ncbi:unnamed protein product [Caenorhabditis auriculariae]|uniref:Uncharacterized protein n=1 Tax=Caenorhabditis auriculariae TaxID=2777116 RepID=A0A8S1HHI4_9PELO|nr:unnamed protein product [Caenorhabditis auriculariae]
MPQENGNNPGFEPEEAPSTSFMTPVKTQENPALSEESAISKESGLDQEVIGNNDGSNSSAFGLEMSPSPPEIFYFTHPKESGERNTSKSPEVEQTTKTTTEKDETAQLTSADKEPETIPSSSSATTPALRRGRPPRTTRKNEAAVKNNTAFGLDMSPSPQKIQTPAGNSLEKESRMPEVAKTKETLTRSEEMNRADTTTISEPGIERTSEKTTENEVVPSASTEKEPETVPSSSSATTPAPRRGRPPRATPKNDPESSASNPLSKEPEGNISTKEDVSVKDKKGPNTEAETTSSFIPPTTPAHRQGRLPKNTPKNVSGYGVSARGINSTNTLRNLGIPSEATKLPLSDDEDGSSSSDNEKALMKPAYLNISKTNLLFEGNPQIIRKQNSSTSASSGNRKSMTPEAGKNTTISSQKASVQPSSSTSSKSRQLSESPSATSAKSTQVQNLRSTKKQTPPSVETPSMATRSRQSSLTPSVPSVSSASKDLPSSTRKTRQSTDTTTPEPSKIVTRSRQSSEQQLERSSTDSKEESIGARVNRRYSGHPTNDTTPLAETASRKRKCEDPSRKTPEPAPKSAARPNQRVKAQKPAENASGPPTRVSKMTAMRAPKRREKAAEDEDPKPVAETRSEEVVEEPESHPQPTDSKRRKAHSKPGNAGSSKAKEDEMKNTEESKPITRSKQVQPSKNVRLEAGRDEDAKSAGRSKSERKTRKQSEIEAAENLETDGLRDLEEDLSPEDLEIETNEKSKPGSKSKSDSEKPTTERNEIVRLQGGQDKDLTGKKSEIAPAKKSKRDGVTTPADLEIGTAEKSKNDPAESSKSAQLGKAQKAKQSESPSTENPKSPISSKNSSVDSVDHTDPIGSHPTSIDSKKSAETPETQKEPQNNVSSEVSRPSTESRSEVPGNSENFTFEMQEDEDDEDRLEIDEPEPIVQQKLPETKPQMVNSATEDVGLAVPEIDDDVAEMKPKVATTVKPPKAIQLSHDPSREEKKPAVNSNRLRSKRKNPAILAAIGLEISDSESDDEETSKLDVPKKEPKAEPVLDAVSASFALKKNQEKAVRKTVLLPDGQPAPKRSRLSGTAKKSPAGSSNTGQMTAAVKKRLSTGSKETAKKRTVSSTPAYAPRAKLRKLEMISNIARGQLLQAFHMKSDPDVIKLQMGDNLKEVEKMPAKDVAEVMIEYLQHSSQSDMWRVVLRLKDTGNPDALTNTEEENFLSTAFSLPNCAGDIWLPFIKKLSSTMALQIFCHAVNFCEIEENVKDEIVRDMLTMIFMNHENTAVAATVYFLLSSVFPCLRWIIEEIEEETCFATLFRSLVYRNKDHFEVISWLLRARFDYVHVLQLTSDETLKRLEAVAKKIEADFADPQKQDSILVISGEENSSVQAGSGLDKYLRDILVLSKTASNDALTFAFSRLKNLITEIENSIFDKDPAKDDSLFTVSAFRKQITQKQALAFFAKWDVIRVVLANFLVGHDVSSSNSVLDALRSIAPQIHEFQEKMKDDELKRVETLDTAGSSEKENEPRRLVQMNVSRIANFIEAFTRYKV